MQLIILAAGKGERLFPLTRNMPKSLIPIGGPNETILGHQLHAAAQAGFTEVLLIGGYLVDTLEHATRTYAERYGITITVRNNPFYGCTNNLASLWFAKDVIENEDQVVIVNGDDLFKPKVLSSLLAVPAEQEITVVVSIKDEYDSDDMKVNLVNDQITWINKQIPEDQAAAESIGMIRVCGSARKALADQLEYMIRQEENLKIFWLEAFNELIRKRQVVSAHVVGSHDWAEMDIHQDLDLVMEHLSSMSHQLDD